MKLRYIVVAWFFGWLLLALAPLFSGVAFGMLVVHAIISMVFAFVTSLAVAIEYSINDKHPRW
jgi:hypothetical protein